MKSLFVTCSAVLAHDTTVSVYVLLLEGGRADLTDDLWFI